MAAEASTLHTLEDLPCDEEKAEPLRLELSLLKTITNNFSKEQVIGSGAYGVVYKALLGDNFIAVKLLGSFSEIEDKTFEREVDCLVRVKHRNIVGFVGYCAESHLEVVWQGVKIILAESQKRLLCFEYMRNGSLRRHLITGEPCGLQWHVCYQIVKGMCQGLHHLHEKHIIHLDLKPDNILLDDDMVPKIADFGLSRLLGVEKSRTVTQNIRGSMGYMAPEYLLHGSITIKSDIYSLGVIIMQMLTGGHTAEPIFENALGIWRCRLESETSQRHTPLEIGYQQVKACIEISTSCTEHKPENRPVTGDIIRRLGETVASGISTSPESNQFRKDVSAQVPQHASHPVHFEAQSQNPPFKGLSRSDVLDASFSEAAEEEDDPLPCIDGLRITGEAFPGRELQASGYSTNGTTSCNFEWLRHLDDGSVNFIEGARQPSYLVTADDVDTLLAVEVQPLDDRKRKGEIVKVYANEGRKITCDPETKEIIKKTLEIGHVSYEVQLPQVRFLDMWEPAVLAIKREGYIIECNGQSDVDVVLTEKFQQATAISVPYERPTEFSIMSADGVEYDLKPAENTLPRDTIVLVLRLFRIMAVEKRLGRKKILEEK